MNPPSLKLRRDATRVENLKLEERRPARRRGVNFVKNYGATSGRRFFMKRVKFCR